MQRARGGYCGYTIIEVLIVLAVSVIVFFAAVLVFAGKQGKTEFAQAMRDIESRIQTAVNDVSVSMFPYAENYTCSVPPPDNRPVLTPLSGTTQETGSNTACIFLGKAVQLKTDNNPNQIIVYTVLGRRADNSGLAVTKLDDANPEAIINIPQLIETYNIPWGANVLSAREDTAPSTNTYLVGFYNSLQPISSAEGSQSILAKGYVGFPSNGSPGLVQTAVRGAANDSKVWTICVQSGTSVETAQLIINTSLAGATTQIKYTTCS
jgi:type II secretory pathway pseudopilin PulG